MRRQANPIDFWRGLVLVFIFINHIPGTYYSRFTHADYSISDSADLFVFPSHSETFGLVMLEALASGLPVAAYPVPGPLDVINSSGAGVLDENLRKAALDALDVPRERCREFALRYSWAACAQQFLDRLCPVH